MLSSIYPIISAIVFWLMSVFVGLLAIRMIIGFADPNPFGTVGRFGYQLRKHTNRFVQPAADFLFAYRIDKKYAPILTAIVMCVLAYFALQIVGNTFFIIDGLTRSIASGNVKAIIGIILYALLSIYILFIFIRLLSSWFVFGRKTFFGFIRRVTDPVMIPVQRLIPPIGMFDISAMIVLIVLQLIQNFVLRSLVF
jgi:YggT family protein